MQYDSLMTVACLLGKHARSPSLHFTSLPLFRRREAYFSRDPGIYLPVPVPRPAGIGQAGPAEGSTLM